LQLERDYDLLKLSVPEMALKHNRTINSIMFKLQSEGLDTFNNLYAKTYGQNYIDDQIAKLNNLCSTEDNDEEDDDEDDEEDDDEDDEEDDDEEYIPDTNESGSDDEDDDEDEDEDDDEDDDEDGEEDYDLEEEINGSNKAYIFNQIKRMHNHINNLLGYFTNGSNKQTASNCY
jgi:E3 ubiquitin-protein ligase HUWE1